MAELLGQRNLPNEILENILAHLPITDLLLSKLVNKQWNDIISRKGVSLIFRLQLINLPKCLLIYVFFSAIKFMLWKKNYHRYRLHVRLPHESPLKSDDDIQSYIKSLCHQNEMTNIRCCTKSLIKQVTHLVFGIILFYYDHSFITFFL